MTYEQAYRQLNDAQRQAVDTIDGPVLVIAGPGTGKTQLLSTRVATILRHTDVEPHNILCLTFTDSGATAMRQRLTSLMGQAGHKVAIHTFHSFGADIINRYPEYFYQGATFRPADDLSGFELLEHIFEQLPHGSPLASKLNGQFTAIADTRAAISHLKRGGLTPQELLAVLDANDVFIQAAEPLLATAFDVPRLTKQQLSTCQTALDKLEQFNDGQPTIHAKPLATICCNELAQALDAATSAGSTAPLTTWRNRWLERDDQRQYVFKDRARNRKLRDVANVYQHYQEGLLKAQLFDFDDMIMQTVQAIEQHPQLRYALQEQYLYIMVDEFQDTNGVQLRLLQNLCNNEINGDRPDILVVGDDDQAIYAFQGAELSNILQFQDLYVRPTIITLTENYRSGAPILQAARQVIVQGQQRLETTLAHVNKHLNANAPEQGSSVELHQFVEPAQQYIWIAQRIGKALADGTPASEIAVIARTHRQLLEIVPFLRQQNLPISYEQHNNVLESEPVVALTLLARIVVALSQQQFDVVDSLLPQLLSRPEWQITATDLWQLSLEAFHQRRFWLELMLEQPEHTRLHQIAEFLIVASHYAQRIPLEQMLDVLTGSSELQAPEEEYDERPKHQRVGPPEEFTSPLRAYFFNQQQLSTAPNEYLAGLHALATIHRKLRNYRPDQRLTVADFLDFVDLHQKTHTSIASNHEPFRQEQGVQLLSAHKAKGLEFAAVFVVGCQEDVWGAGARHRSSMVQFPHNLPLEPAGQEDDDCLRLFYVAMTRAKQHLYLTYYSADANQKPSLLASFLTPIEPEVITHQQPIPSALQAKIVRPSWQSNHLQTTDTWRQLLQPHLQQYALSVTHLNNFIDVTNGGPQAFLLQNLLRFPQAPLPESAFGTAIHSVLRRAHIHLTQTGERRPVEDILHDFELQLHSAHLSDRDRKQLLEKGSHMLSTYLAARYDQFQVGQKTEYRLHNVQLGKARLTGKLDVLTIDKTNRHLHVIDYKTGKPAGSWQGRTDYEKIKLHKYRQQLQFYKLLLDNAAEFDGRFTIASASVEFIEPAANGEVRQLQLVFDNAEMERFIQLVQAVWHKIMTLDLPDTSQFSASYKGLQEFEASLLEG